jgi:acyl carrier protein
MNDILDKVKNSLESQFAIPRDYIKPDSDLVNDLGLDSLDLVELLMSSEEQFGFTLKDSEVEGIKTVMDITNLIEKHYSSVKPSSQSYEMPPQRKYDEEAELVRYSLQHCRHLMTDAEKRADIFISKDMKAKGYSKGDSAKYKAMAEKLGIATKDDAVTELMKDGNDAFHHHLHQRLLQSPELRANRCPNCNRVVESPNSRQCLWCGNDWHNEIKRAN